MSFLGSVKSSIRIGLRPLTRFLRPAPLSHLEPVSRLWGFERGTPIPRWYIDRWIESHRNDITGDVLEIKNRRYIDAYGINVLKADILDIDTSNTHANIFADLSKADNVASDQYDCFILTETLHYIFNLSDAIMHSHRILKKNGILLVSVPSIAQQDTELAHVDHWRFTVRGCERLFGQHFEVENVQVESYGNFASCVAALSGVAVEEMSPEVLVKQDDKFALGVLIRARKI